MFGSPPSTILRHLLLLLPLALSAAEPAISPATRPTPPPPLVQLGEQQYKMGQVTIHTGRKEIHFPAKINQREELIEYLLVMTGGKTHESLLVTETPAHEIHIAMLFLGTRGMPEVDPEEWLKNPILTGDSVDILIRWNEAGKSHEAPAENWITHVETQQPMSPGPWIYNGSWTFQGSFQAEAEKSLFAVFQDRSALVNNPRKDRDDDEMWSVRTQNIPPLNHPVEVILKLRVVPKPDATESQ